ncbi:MAG: sugar phosphate isomerase/epimerase family protein [Chloroflexota bacterium]
MTSAARHLGYEGVELRLLDGEVIPPYLPADRRRQVKQAFATAGIAIACVDTSARFTAPDPAARRKQEQDARAYLQLANDWESPIIRVFGGNLAEGTSETQGVQYLAESLSRLAPDAERAGVTIALETHDAFSAGRLVAEVMGQVPSAHVAPLWDTHHPYRMGETVEQTWDYIGERMVHTHVKDARRKPDGGWQLVLLGHGEVPVKEALARWAQHGYDGFVCVEWEKKWHPEIEEPEVAFPQHIAVLREYLASITTAPSVNAGPS